MRRFAAAALAVLLAAPAAVLAAASVPRFLPAQDVIVDYRLDLPGQPSQGVELAYNARHGLARIAAKSQSIFVLADLPAGHAELVVPALHALVEAPDFSALTGMVENADNARFTRLGEARYAGLVCTNYLVLAAQGTATACLTRDGVVLHFSGHDAHGTATLTAHSVAYTPQPPAEFQPPPGFAPVQLPAGTIAALLQPPP
jgi:hypothetical protein